MVIIGIVSKQIQYKEKVVRPDSPQAQLNVLEGKMQLHPRTGGSWRRRPCKYGARMKSIMEG